MDGSGVHDILSRSSDESIDGVGEESAIFISSSSLLEPPLRSELALISGTSANIR